jgi:hypothetical protein
MIERRNIRNKKMESQWINRQSIINAIEHIKGTIKTFEEVNEAFPNQEYMEGYTRGLQESIAQLTLLLSNVYILSNTENAPDNDDKHSELTGVLNQIEAAKDLAYKFIHISYELQDKTIRQLIKRRYKVSQLADLRNYVQLTKIEWE